MKLTGELYEGNERQREYLIKVCKDKGIQNPWIMGKISAFLRIQRTRMNRIEGRIPKILESQDFKMSKAFP